MKHATDCSFVDGLVSSRGRSLVLSRLQTPSMVVPLREGADRPTANSLALRLSRLSLSQLLHNNGGVVVRERLVKGDSVRATFCFSIAWLHVRPLESQREI